MQYLFCFAINRLWSYLMIKNYYLKVRLYLYITFIKIQVVYVLISHYYFTFLDQQPKTVSEWIPGTSHLKNQCKRHNVGLLILRVGLKYYYYLPLLPIPTYVLSSIVNIFISVLFYIKLYFPSHHRSNLLYINNNQCIDVQRTHKVRINK